MRKPLIAGNWKMYKTLAEASEYALAFREAVADVVAVDILLCAPAPLCNPLAKLLKDSNVQLGAQNLYWEEKGAFTGEVSGPMLESVGCNYVLVGHSERRHIFGETDEDVNRKLRAALAAYLTPVFCIGETLEQREAGETSAVLTRQVTEGLKGFAPEEVAKMVIAYEPVWAIGTGVTATPNQANEAHRVVRDLVKVQAGEAVADALRILYGGSVKPDNIVELMREPEIDGALVGGASLSVDSFVKIVKYYETSEQETRQ
ncbi:MAG: triose-phosphate isomerase [Verrucomicrobia bacterium]|nr:triose-phosphate isomerase [Verrucomicrobiota bacterium]